MGVGRWGPGFLARGDVWEFISLFSTEGHIVKMGERCPAMYVTVSFITSVMMKTCVSAAV